MQSEQIQRDVYVDLGMSPENIHQNLDILVHQNDFADNLSTVECTNAGDPHKLVERDDNRIIRKAQGQLSWLASQTRTNQTYRLTLSR